MYKYEYENIICDINGFGPFSGNIYVMEDYKEVIETRSQNGWRYVGFIPKKQRGTGHIQEIDLVFEKEIKDDNL